MPGRAVKYIAELEHVREVTMIGGADLDFWKAKLKDKDLMLAEKDGRAQILVIAAASKYLGIRFQEVSFSVLIDGFQQERIAGAYLLHAYNSSRLFAFCERTLFSTPYHHANIRVTCSPPSVQVADSGIVIFQAEMGAEDSTRAPAESHHAYGGWQGPVLLPKTRRQARDIRKLFFAKIGGDTQTQSFDPADDTLRLHASRAGDVIQDLIDSRFEVREWAIREDATHARSKTFKCNAATIAMARDS